VFLNFT